MTREVASVLSPTLRAATRHSEATTTKRSRPPSSLENKRPIRMPPPAAVPDCRGRVRRGPVLRLLFGQHPIDLLQQVVWIDGLVHEEFDRQIVDVRLEAEGGGAVGGGRHQEGGVPGPRPP